MKTKMKHRKVEAPMNEQLSFEAVVVELLILVKVKREIFKKIVYHIGKAEELDNSLSALLRLPEASGIALKLLNNYPDNHFLSQYIYPSGKFEESEALSILHNVGVEISKNYNEISELLFGLIDENSEGEPNE